VDVEGVGVEAGVESVEVAVDAVGLGAGDRAYSSVHLRAV